MTKSDQAENYLVSLRKRHCPAAIGNKARGLFELKRKGYLIPDTFVCQWQAYQDYISSGEEALVRLRTELTAVVREGRAYAVRSSANLEDDLEQSFAGQFSTHLNVIGLYQVLSSVRAIWEDTQKESIHTYLHRRLGRDQELLMAVIIQEMIQPALSGVVFSKNPITTMDEIIVEAVRGYGTDLVQSGFTPLRWVNKWGNWIEKPECSPMDQAVIEEIVKQTRCIVKHFHKELDLEWVWDGQRLYWLQMRDITSLQNVTFYSNRIAKEMTPGQIKPLVWTVSIPNPTLAWVKLISEAIGENPLDPAKMLKLFHYRAYFNMAEFGKVFASLGLPRESLEMMMGVLPPGAGRPPMKPSMKAVVKLPRLAKFAWDKWSFSRVLETRYPLLFEEIHKFPIQFKPGSVEQSWLIQQIDRIHPLNREIAYLTVVTILMMMVYISLLRRQLAKRKVDFQEVDLTAGEEEFKLFDPSFQLADLHRQYLLLPPEIQYYFQAGDFSSFLKTDDYLGMKDHVNQFLERFGHMSDTTAHFCNPAWREQPGMILKLIANYEKPAEQSPQRMDLQELPGSSFILKYLFRRAREYRLWRERISSLFSYSVMLFRAYYLAIAENWVINGWIEKPEDILYLYDDEIRALLSKGTVPTDEELSNKIYQRKQEMQACAGAILPEVIMGEDIPLIVSASSQKLTGIPASKGYYAGPVCVVKGVDEFHKMKAGDVLVIPFSDVSWTPLFARAGAVVAESGGILSHSSIIAREYNIPGIVSVNGALTLKDGEWVTIDGFRGEILIHDNIPLATVLPQEKFSIE